MEEIVGKTIFLFLLVGLNLGGLSVIKLNLFRLVVGFLTPFVVIMANIPFSPYFPIILVLLGIMNLTIVGDDLR